MCSTAVSTFDKAVFKTFIFHCMFNVLYWDRVKACLLAFIIFEPIFEPVNIVLTFMNALIF